MDAYPYPLTIIADRYNGAYSGGQFLAFNVVCDALPEEVDGEDLECSRFWNGECDKWVIGVADSPNEALLDLVKKLKS